MVSKILIFEKKNGGNEQKTKEKHLPNRTV